MVATAIRTDVHRPSAPEFDPQAYEFLACGDYGTSSERPDLREVNEAIRRYEKLGYRIADHQPAGACGHCGARLRYHALLAREDARELLIVGETCVSSRFTGQTAASFAALRKAAELDRSKQRSKAVWLRLCDAHPGIAYASYAADIIDGYVSAARDPHDALHVKAGADWALGTLADIAYKARRNGCASERQIAFVERLWAEVAERVAAHAERAPEPQVPPAPAGKVEVEGVVVSTRWQDSDYGAGCLKALVASDAGWRVWTTVPASIVDATDKGDRIRFTATLTPKDGDPTFAIARRPTKASVLTSAAG